MFENEVVSLSTFVWGLREIEARPEVKAVVISREMALFLGQHINLLEEQLDAARS